MVDTAQLPSQAPLLSAAQVAQEARMQQAPNGICYAAYGDTQITPEELERIVQAVPAIVANALTSRGYYFVPLTIGESSETEIASRYTVDLSDRAICHRNVKLGSADCIFISTRLMQDRFALAFEYFINVGHHFVEAVGVPESFSELIWAQAGAEVRGETSHDAWESRRRALHHDSGRDLGRDQGRDSGRRDDSAYSPSHITDTISNHSGAQPAAQVDEKARSSYYESAFADAIAIYMLALTIDFDYTELREREYPLLAAPALAERLRHVCSLFPPNPGYDFEIRYRRKG